MPEQKTLIITNGSSAAALLKVNKAADVCLSWDDVLHEGPVPMCKSLGALSAIRIEFLKARYAATNRNTVNAFENRDDLIADHGKFDRIELWFEHDLFDQLQLIQILDYFAGAGLPDGKLFLIQTDDYLGAQLPDEIMRFRKLSAPVSPAQFRAARTAWRAFRQSTPEIWASLLGQDLSALPWLASAVERMLEELPSTQLGLSRTATEFLRMIEDKRWHLRKCVGMYLGKQAEPMFVGDWTLYNLLAEFSQADQPLIKPLRGCWTSQDLNERELFWQSPVRFTPLARDLLAGNADQITVNGIDRWWGGTHLTTDACWRWDVGAQTLVAP